MRNAVARLDRIPRKRVFEKDGLRLWLDAQGYKSVKGAILELERLKPGTRSAWEPCWRGIVRMEANGVIVEPWGTK